jgi:hypothetical protein
MGFVMKTELLNPHNSAVMFIDFQHQMTFGDANIDTVVRGAPVRPAGAAGH